MNGTGTETLNGRCPDCLLSQDVGSGNSATCRNDECELVAPTSIFKATFEAANTGGNLQSQQNRAWTIGGSVD